MKKNNDSSTSVSSSSASTSGKKTKKKKPAPEATTTVESVAPATASASPAASSSISLLPSPPPLSSIPPVPAGTEPPGGENYRALLPRAIELAALPGAVKDLQRWTGFPQVFGITGLSYSQVIAAFAVAAEWSAMRKAIAAWNLYCMTQEGISWGIVRSIMQTMKPTFDIAVRGSPSLATTLPSVVTLLGAQKAISQKGASTRALNRAAKARGEPQTHGAAGKRRARVAAKAALASQTAATQAGTPAAAAAPAATPAANGVATPANGAAHS